MTLATLVAMVAVLLALPTAAIADTACGDPFTPIPEIQGSGDDSPFDGMDNITTEGVVTVDLQQSSEFSGFFISDPDGDDDPATSDGLFVRHRDTWTPAFNPSVGDRVRVTGEVDEQFPGNTQLEFLTDAEICSTGNKVKPLKLKVREFNEDPERYEGMYVEFKGNLVVTDTFDLHREGEVWLSEDDVVEIPTNELTASDPNLLDFATDQIASTFLLDDGKSPNNPDPIPFLTEDGTLRLGDRTKNVTGAINEYEFEYRLQPDKPVEFKTKNKRPEEPKIKGDVVVASFNVLNYWTTLGGRGADTAEQLAAQQSKLVSAILGMDADIVGLQEIENDPNCGDPATPCDHTPIETLVAALNAEMGSSVWSWVGPVDHYNYYPIRNEIIYRNDRVAPVGPPVALADPSFDTFRDPSTPLTANDSQLGRPPVAQTFSADGEVFTVVNNHFKSKGSSCEDPPVNDPDTDEQGNCNGTRVAQANAVLGWLGDLVAASGDPDVLVIGDLNSYFREDPILQLETQLVNLLTKHVKDPYSFNFFAFFVKPFAGRGALDHALATPSLADQVKDATIWHINADEPRFLDWFDPSRLAPGPYRSSDHDPVLVGLDLKKDKTEAVDLQFITVSDWHAQLDPLFVFGEGTFGGAAELATYFDMERAANPNTLIFTAGDAYGGSPPLSGFFNEEPAVRAMRMMGFDYDTFGNHNFDRGFEHLQEMIDIATAKEGKEPGEPFEYVVANLEGRKGHLKGVKDFDIVKVGGVKIAIIGVINPEAPTLVFPGSFGDMTISDPVAAANAARAEAEKKGAEVFVLLGHMGVTGFDPGGNAVGPLIDLANGVNGFDLVVGDHTNAGFSDVINGALVVENRSRGRTYARVSMTVDVGKKATSVIDSSVEFVDPVSDAVTPDPEIEAYLAPLKAELDVLLGEVIGQSTVFIPRADSCGNGAGRTCESLVGNVTTDALRDRYGTDFAITNSGGLRADLTCPAADLPDDFCPAPDGGDHEITAGQVLTVLPFGNSVVTLTVTGAQLKEHLERGVSAMPGVSGRFAQVSGLCFTYDINLPVGSRVTSAVFQEADGSCGATAVDLTGGTSYTLAENDFMASGGDGYPVVIGSAVTREFMDQVVSDFIAASTPISPAIQGRINCVDTGAPGPNLCPAPLP